MKPQDLVSGSVRLVSLPEVCIRVNEMLDDPKSTTADIGKVIAQDTNLTARLLKIVNSSYYGFPSRIETVSRAITVIGFQELQGLVIAASAVETFTNVPLETLNKVKFWRHSLYCGVVARLLAEKSHVLHSERLFVAGLLHDIGKLVIALHLPEEAVIIHNESQLGLRPEFEIEREVLGFDHADVGGELIKQWKLPRTLFDAVAFHHQPQAAESGMMEASLVHIANIMADEAELGLDLKEKTSLQPIDYRAWEITRLDPDDARTVLRDAGPMFSEALETILPRSYPRY